jgi:TPR repeat protein
MITDVAQPQGFRSGRRRSRVTAARTAGHTKAQLRLGFLLAEQMDPPELAEARVWLTRAAQAGAMDAQDYLNEIG